MQKGVTVVTRIRAAAGKERAVREMLLTMLEPSSAERGCVCYELHVSAEDPAQFLFYERWHSRADFEKHLRMPYQQVFLSKSEELLAEPMEIGIWELLG